jgi:predicted transcriptional regulator YdeE
MVKTEPVVEKRLSFTVVGVTYEATLPQVIEQDLGKNAYNTVLARREDFEGRELDAVILVQVYPMKPGFNPHVDPFTQLIGYRVADGSPVPEGMVARVFPECEYVMCTHRGPESELGATYDKLYGKWMHEHGRRPAGFDFEVWDERFQPEEPNSEIDLFVALAGD